MSLIRYRMPWRSPYFLVGDRLRRAARGLAERPHNGAPRQADLEVVVSVAFGAVQQPIRGLRKCGRVSVLAELSSGKLNESLLAVKPLTLTVSVAVAVKPPVARSLIV